MKNDPMEAWKNHKAALDRLNNIPDEKRPKTVNEALVVREAIQEHENAMKALERRLSYDQKKELGILTSQRIAVIEDRGKGK